MKRVILSVVAVVALVGAGVILRAQDAAKVDEKHYTVAFENDQVRVLKVHYGPGEKSTMHSHPNTVAVFLTDAKGRFTFPDGKSQDFNRKAGDVISNDATVHLPENTGDKAFDVVVVELKGKPSAKQPVKDRRRATSADEILSVSAELIVVNGEPSSYDI